MLSRGLTREQLTRFPRTTLTHPFHSVDRQDIFRQPVSPEDVPDYLDVVERPMSWSVIDEKLSSHQYLDLRDFKVRGKQCSHHFVSPNHPSSQDDIKLVATNAMLYNKPGTTYHKTAQKVLGAAEPILAELDRLIIRPPATVGAADEACTVDDMDEDDRSPPPSPPRPPIGDLEPPLELLDLLLRVLTL